MGAPVGVAGCDVAMGAAGGDVAMGAAGCDVGGCGERERLVPMRNVVPRASQTKPSLLPSSSPSSS
eukprot:6462503-Prymnesium_polylepis.2